MEWIAMALMNPYTFLVLGDLQPLVIDMIISSWIKISIFFPTFDL